MWTGARRDCNYLRVGEVVVVRVYINPKDTPETSLKLSILAEIVFSPAISCEGKNGLIPEGKVLHILPAASREEGRQDGPLPFCKVNNVHPGPPVEAFQAL